MENGLTFNLFDASRKIAGDRWFISILARVEIPVKDSIIDEEGVSVKVEDVRALIGDKVLFEKKWSEILFPKMRKREWFHKLPRTS